MNDPAQSRRSALIALAVTGLGVGLGFILEHWAWGWGNRHSHILLAACWLYLPLLPIIHSKKETDNFGISTGSGLRGLAETLAATIVVLIPFYAVFFAIYPAKWGLHTLPNDLWAIAPAQFLAIALPEEFFFRGYLQTELEDISAKKVKILGAELGWGWVAASALFALGHLAVLPTPMRAAVFFPALLFGWLRARTGSVIYPAIMHALFNFTFLAAQELAGI